MHIHVSLMLTSLAAEWIRLCFSHVWFEVLTVTGKHSGWAKWAAAFILWMHSPPRRAHTPAEETWQSAGNTDSSWDSRLPVRPLEPQVEKWRRVWAWAASRESILLSVSVWVQSMLSLPSAHTQIPPYKPTCFLVVTATSNERSSHWKSNDPFKCPC